MKCEQQLESFEQGPLRNAKRSKKKKEKKKEITRVMNSREHNVLLYVFLTANHFENIHLF